MRQSFRMIALCAAVAFLLAFLPGCIKNINDLGSMKIGNLAQTKTVDKGDLGKGVKTQWGVLTFSSKEVTKIKKLKDVSKLKNKSDITKNTYSVTKKIGSKSIGIAVTYLGQDKYQLTMGGF